MWENIWGCVLPILSFIWCLLNSNFITALAGAFAGAIAAYLIAKRRQRSEQILQEIRNTNVAIAIAFDITNSFISIKKEQTAPLMTDYENSKASYNEFLERKRRNEIPETAIFSPNINLIDIDIPNIPIETLHNLITDRISSIERVIRAVTVLQRSYISFEKAVSQREYLKKDILAAHEDGTFNDLAAIYYAQKTQDGRINTTYPDAMRNISICVDDCIYFSNLIGRDLHEYGCELAKKYGRKSPKISRIQDFPEDLMPNHSEYHEWNEFFKNDENSNNNKSILDRLKF
ncbi:hypothetical protein [uncultured Sneathiella sp.]|uniref:hypothetical protein n=1 Tax=uncultured Sneathiella sp. TaxID=879315 RepID=UPI0030EE39E1|tara:strand:+ start:382 stop:1248 length:867 start_codon:yes stop_codon:yes gene_type:complete